MGWKQKCQKAEQDLQKSKMEAQELKKTKEGMIVSSKSPHKSMLNAT